MTRTEQCSFRIDLADGRRITALAERYNMTRYGLGRRLLLLALTHVERGGDLFFPDFSTGLEVALSHIASALHEVDERPAYLKSLGDDTKRDISVLVAALGIPHGAASMPHYEDSAAPPVEPPTQPGFKVYRLGPADPAEGSASRTLR